LPSSRFSSLLLRAGALGDVLLLRRAIASLRTAGHDVTLLAPSTPASALVGSGLADVAEVIPWESADAASLLLPEGPPAGPFRDRVARHDAAIAYTTSTPILDSLRRLIPQVLDLSPAPPASVHASEWLARPTRGLGADPAPLPPTHIPTDRERAAVLPWRERLGDRFVAVHPGSGSPAKNWPAPRFADLAAGLAGGRPWLLVEGPADAEAARIVGRVPGSVMARALGPRLLGALLAEADLYVGNDSGVTHLAAAWGAPTLALFGPTDPNVWSPVGARVRILRAADGVLEKLGVHDVLDAARRWREAGAPT
jgi:heptosyltransferase III